MNVCTLMVKRFLLLSLIASFLVLAPAAPASACSCAALEPAEDLARFDIAFVGRLVERPASGGSYEENAAYTFEVETWVKGGSGAEIIVFSPNQGSACGFETPIGERVGVLARVENGKAMGGLCTTVDADLLLAGDRPLVIDGAGPPAFLVTGRDGAARLMLLDASGGLLATVGEDDESLNGFSLCPGSESLVELVNDDLVVRTTAGLEEVRRVDLDDLPSRVGVSVISCRDERGEKVLLATEEWSEETGNVFRLFDADDMDSPLLEGGYGWLDVGVDHAVGGEWPTGERIWRIDLDSRERSLLHKIPVEAGDSSPDGRGWIDPSGQRVMIAQWRWNDAVGGFSQLFLYELKTGGLLWQSDTLPTSDGIGWIDATTFLASSYPDIDSDEVNYLLIDTGSDEMVHLDGVPGWKPLRVGDHLVGVTGAKLQIMPLTGGETTDLRLLPSEGHHLVAVLDADATLTPTTTTSKAPTTNPNNDPASATESGPEAAAETSDSDTTLPWPGIAVAAAIAVAMIVGVIRYRRSDRRARLSPRSP